VKKGLGRDGPEAVKPAASESQAKGLCIEQVVMIQNSVIVLAADKTTGLFLYFFQQHFYFFSSLLIILG
jgi:hypothetical protein